MLIFLGEIITDKINIMTDDFLQEIFPSLVYDFGEVNWNIITKEAWDKYINNGQKFNEKNWKT